MTDRIEAGTLQVDKELYDFINNEALPGTGVSPEAFWSGFDRLVHDLAPRNRELLATRDDLQAKIDDWYQENRDQPIDLPDYKSVLQEIGYLVPEGDDFTVSTANVDPEISTIAGPQLVVPVTNARYALNAANARWGSLYDALYGTDVISDADGAERAGAYNKVRGDRVIAFARAFLDSTAPLAAGSHADATSYAVVDGALAVTLRDASVTALATPTMLAGYSGDAAAPSAVLLKHNGLHVEITIDRDHPVGRDDAAGVRDVVVEAAMTTIMVSPMARETASRIPPMMPGSAAGKITFFMVSDWVAPSAREPSRMAWGTALITSSDREDTNGMIMMPITAPAARALWLDASIPMDAARSLINGATVRAAKKP